MPDVIEQAKRIEYCSRELLKLVPKLHDTVMERAKSESAYDKAMMIATVKLDEGSKKYRADEVRLMAKGMCEKEKERMILGECSYKALLSEIEVHKAIMSGMQSIFRHLDAT